MKVKTPQNIYRFFQLIGCTSAFIIPYGVLSGFNTLNSQKITPDYHNSQNYLTKPNTFQTNSLIQLTTIQQLTTKAQKWFISDSKAQSNTQNTIGYSPKSYSCRPNSSTEKVVFVAANGQDNGAGSQNSPFATINHAVSHLAGQGGIIYLREGVYTPPISQKVKFFDNGTKNAAVYINQGGTKQNPLKICSYPNETATIDGSHLDNKTALFYIEETSWIEVIGLEIRNSQGRGLEVKVAKNIALYGNNVHDNQLNGITIRGTMWGDVKQNRARNIRAEGNLVINNYKKNSGSNKEKQNWGQGLQARNAENIELINNKVVENWGEGIGLVSVNNAKVIHNTIIDNYSVNLYFDNAQSSIAENNFILATGNPKTMKSNRDTNNIQMANERYANLGDTPEFYLSKNVIRNNIVVGGNEGFHYGVYAGAHSTEDGKFLGLRDTVIENNTFYGNKSLFLITEDPNTSNVSIKNNIFANPTIPNIDGIKSFNGLKFESNNWYNVQPNAAATSPSDSQENPLFNNPGGTEAIDYQLSDDSPTKAANIGASM